MPLVKKWFAFHCLGNFHHSTTPISLIVEYIIDHFSTSLTWFLHQALRIFNNCYYITTPNLFLPTLIFLLSINITFSIYIYYNINISKVNSFLLKISFILKNWWVVKESNLVLWIFSPSLNDHTSSQPIWLLVLELNQSKVAYEATA